jgi:uncharacterized membrane protein
MRHSVIFIMISYHFPGTYGNSSKWMILSALILAGRITALFVFYVCGSKTGFELPEAPLEFPLLLRLFAGLQEGRAVTRWLIGAE